MIWTNLFRFILTLALVAICGVLLIGGQDVADWLQVLTAGAVGNTFRLAPSKD